MLQIQGTKVCLGVDALNESGASLTRFVAPVTMLATGGAGQVPFSFCAQLLLQACCPMLWTIHDVRHHAAFQHVLMSIGAPPPPIDSSVPCRCTQSPPILV